MIEARKNIRLSKRTLGFVDLHTARAYVQAANECEVAGLIQEAHDYQKEAWQLFIDTLGPAHFSTQEAKADLLRSKGKLGLVDEASEVQKDTVALFKSNSGPTDPGTLEEVTALIQSLLDFRRSSEALALAEATVHELEALKNPPAEIDTRWLPILKARLKEARKAVPGK